jgi:hypothetical protein
MLTMLGYVNECWQLLSTAMHGQRKAEDFSPSATWTSTASTKHRRASTRMIQMLPILSSSFFLMFPGATRWYSVFVAWVISNFSSVHSLLCSVLQMHPHQGWSNCCQETIGVKFKDEFLWQSCIPKLILKKLEIPMCWYIYLNFGKRLCMFGFLALSNWIAPNWKYSVVNWSVYSSCAWGTPVLKTETTTEFWETKALRWQSFRLKLTFS